MFQHIKRLPRVESVLRYGKEAFCDSFSIQSCGLKTEPKWQVLTGSPSSSSLLLNVDGQSCYLFNCGESTGKMMKFFGHKHAHRYTKVSSLKHVFVTNAQWKNIGGIPGLCLTLSKNKFPSLTLHGSQSISQIHQITGNYNLDKSRFQLNNFPNQSYFKDELIKVLQIPLPRSRPKERPKFHSSLDAEALDRTIITKILDDPYYKDIQAFAFVVKIRGTDQSTLIVDLPDPEYLSSLTSLLPSMLENINKIFHLSGPDIIHHSNYRKWLELWSDNVKHLTLNSIYGNTTIIKDDYYEILRRINSKTFPNLSTINTSRRPDSWNLDNLKLLNCCIGHIIEGNGEVTLPENRFKTQSPFLNDNLPTKLRKNYPIIQFLGTGSKESNLHRNVSCILVQTSEESYIMLDCGEGSLAQLTALKGPDTETVLTKLKMIFISHQHTDHHLGLNSILITREKALDKKLQKSTKLEDDKSTKIEEEKSANQLFIVCSGFYAYMLARYHTLLEPVCSHTVFINAKYLLNLTTASSDRIALLELDDTQEERLLREQNVDAMLKASGLQSIQTCPAVHSADSYSIAFTTKPQITNKKRSRAITGCEEGFKITYSGDTRPNHRLSRIGQGSDLLIHEATFSNCSLDQAILYKHSTLSEAILVGKNMEAKFTILTHFSVLFQKMPQIWDLRNQNSVGIAFDFMTVDPISLPAACSSLTTDLEKEFRETLQILDIKLSELRAS